MRKLLFVLLAATSLSWPVAAQELFDDYVYPIVIGHAEQEPQYRPIAKSGHEGGDGRSVDVPVDPDKVTALRVFVTLPKDRLAEAAEGFQIIAEDRQGHERDVYSANFNVPGAK